MSPQTASPCQGRPRLLALALIGVSVNGCSADRGSSPVPSEGDPGSRGSTFLAGGATGVIAGGGAGGASLFAAGGAAGIESGGTPGIVGAGGAPASGGAIAQAGAVGSGGTGAAEGGLGSGGSGGTGGSPSGDAGSTPGSYQPCPTDGAPCKILPLGDSITWGVGDEPNGGYRGPLFALAIASGKKITFTGSLSNGPALVAGQLFPQKNEGHMGWGISTVTPYSGGAAGIATVIPFPAFADSSGGLPNVILMMIGTNDATESTAAAMTERLGALVDKITSGAPDALLVMAKITPLAWANAAITSYNDAIDGLVVERAAPGKHVLVADMNTGFTPTMMGQDGIHPNASGYQFMAAEWYAVIGPFLP